MSNLIQENSASSNKRFIDYDQRVSGFQIDDTDLVSSVRSFNPSFQINANTVTTISPNSIDEINRRYFHYFEQHFTPLLIHLIRETDFEYGMQNIADTIVREQMKHNSFVTKSWLNDVFIDNYKSSEITIGLLRIIARIPYEEMYPEGQTMALSALSHSDVEVKECGVRAFENWSNLASLNVLEKQNVTPTWLQEYIDEVVKYLRKKHNVDINKEN